MAYWSFANRPNAAPTAAVDPETLKSEVQHAYDRGRLDGLESRRGPGLLSFIVVILAALGVGFIALAIDQGSFGAGGAIVDSTISQTTGRVAASMPAPPAANAPAQAPAQPSVSSSVNSALDAAAQSSR